VDLDLGLGLVEGTLVYQLGDSDVLSQKRSECFFESCVEYSLQKYIVFRFLLEFCLFFSRYHFFTTTRYAMSRVRVKEKCIFFLVQDHT